VVDPAQIQPGNVISSTQVADARHDYRGGGYIEEAQVKGFVGRKINPLAASGSVSNTFDGKGATTSSNLFTGAITATVVEVLANGNLVIAGEKQIGIRRNSEVLKFTGVVDPAQIQPGNVISSTQVADARLDYRGGGYIEEAQVKGWLSRFFDSFSPF